MFPPTYRLTNNISGAQPVGVTTTADCSWPTLAFDSATGKSIVFGGRATSASTTSPYAYAQAGTSSWNGSVFTQLAPASASPPARTGFATVYDEMRNQTWLFGGAVTDGNGSTSRTALDDMWMWNGQTWSQMTVATKPSARSNYALAYNSIDGTTLLFGGLDANDDALGDTWMWDGETWTNIVPTGASSPTARSYHAMAYDPIRNVTVLAGGATGAGAAVIADGEVWEWDGTAWRRRQLLDSVRRQPRARFRRRVGHHRRVRRDLLHRIRPRRRALWGLDLERHSVDAALRRRPRHRDRLQLYHQPGPLRAPLGHRLRRLPELHRPLRPACAGDDGVPGDGVRGDDDGPAQSAGPCSPATSRCNRSIRATPSPSS